MMIVLLGLAAALASPQEAIVHKAERFNAIMAAGPLAPNAVPIDISVNRWGDADSRRRLAAAFEAGGQVALLEALRKEGAAGYVMMPHRERLVAGYIEEERRPDGGRRVLLLCVRDGGDWEFTRDSGWTDHLFRVIALTLDPQDHGAGMLFHVAKVSVTTEKGVDLVSELTGQPTKLLSVRKTR